MSEEVAIRVPAELAASFEDALNRQCFACGDPVRDHVSTSKCPCCAKGTKLPSQAADELFHAMQDSLKSVRDATVAIKQSKTR